MPLLATPSETHGVSGFKITKMSKQECLNKELRVIRLGVVLLFSLTFCACQENKDRLNGVILLIGRRARL